MSKSNSRNFSKILIIQTASIGDVILATPLIEKLAFCYRNSTIDFLLKKGTEGVLANNPFINNLIIWDKRDKKYHNLISIIKMVRNQKYDLIIVVQRFFTAGLIAFLANAEVTVGFNKNPFSFFFNHRVRHSISDDPQQSMHEIDRNLKLIEVITGNQDMFPMKIYPSKHDDAKMSQYKTQAYICIAPASLWFTKQFPAEKWIDFIKNIDPNLRIYFVGAPNDIELSEKIIFETGFSNTLNLCGKVSFLESASLMRDAIMNFVNDSAPQHLASAVNAPVTSIFCSTVPAFGFGPKSKNSSIIETAETLPCRPCGLHGFQACPKKHFKCAKTININQLLQKLPDFT